VEITISNTPNPYHGKITLKNHRDHPRRAPRADRTQGAAQGWGELCELEGRLEGGGRASKHLKVEKRGGPCPSRWNCEPDGQPPTDLIRWQESPRIWNWTGRTIYCETISFRIVLRLLKTLQRLLMRPENQNVWFTKAIWSVLPLRRHNHISALPQPTDENQSSSDWVLPRKPAIKDQSTTISSKMESRERDDIATHLTEPWLWIELDA